MKLQTEGYLVIPILYLRYSLMSAWSIWMSVTFFLTPIVTPSLSTPYKLPGIALPALAAHYTCSH